MGQAFKAQGITGDEVEIQLTMDNNELVGPSTEAA